MGSGGGFCLSLSEKARLELSLNTVPVEVAAIHMCVCAHVCVRKARAPVLHHRLAQELTKTWQSH